MSLGVSKDPIRRILKAKYGITGHKERLTEKRKLLRTMEDHIRKLYLDDGMSSEKISRELGFKCPGYLVYEFLNELNIIRNRSEAAVLRVRKRWTMTEPERQFQDWCSEHNIECVYQYQISENGHNYDFYIPTLHTLIEIDGDFWHGLDGVRHDALELQERDRMLNTIAKKKGYRIKRFPVSEIRKQGDIVFEEALFISPEKESVNGNIR